MKPRMKPSRIQCIECKEPLILAVGSSTMDELTLDCPRCRMLYLVEIEASSIRYLDDDSQEWVRVS